MKLPTRKQLATVYTTHQLSDLSDLLTDMYMYGTTVSLKDEATFNKCKRKGWEIVSKKKNGEVRVWIPGFPSSNYSVEED